MDARESGQIRKEAAFIGRTRVPQIAWPSLQSTKSFCPLTKFCNAPFIGERCERRKLTRPLPTINAAHVDRVDQLGERAASLRRLK